MQSIKSLPKIQNDATGVEWVNLGRDQINLSWFSFLASLNPMQTQTWC
jgi:hypothetical protein